MKNIHDDMISKKSKQRKILATVIDKLAVYIL
jgi:hypothetical protein